MIIAAIVAPIATIVGAVAAVPSIITAIVPPIVTTVAIIVTRRIISSRSEFDLHSWRTDRRSDHDRRRTSRLGVPMTEHERERWRRRKRKIKSDPKVNTRVGS